MESCSNNPEHSITCSLKQCQSVPCHGMPPSLIVQNPPFPLPFPPHLQHPQTHINPRPPTLTPPHPTMSPPPSPPQDPAKQPPLRRPHELQRARHPLPSAPIPQSRPTQRSTQLYHAYGTFPPRGASYQQREVVDYQVLCTSSTRRALQLPKNLAPSFAISISPIPSPSHALPSQPNGPADLTCRARTGSRPRSSATRIWPVIVSSGKGFWRRRWRQSWWTTARLRG